MLLQTKLLVPQPHSGAVRRAALMERLDRATETPLTLISAPAGFGKTSLLSGWIHEHSMSVAWYSIDVDDDEPTRFWTYLVEALRGAQPALGEAALQVMRSPSPPDGRALATMIANDAAASQDTIVCVLDDLHVIEDPAIHAAVEYLVSHAPPNLRFIVSTRADPPWQLASLRARGQVSEMRANDLRFDDEEARSLLENAGLQLLPGDARAVGERTEGWVAGLRLAALSMRGRDDPSSFISEFEGSHRFVLDYLSQEVLARQPADVHDFLVRTSILRRLHGDLCDAVTGSSGGAEMLAALEQSNLFTDALDDERRWCRYHKLFSDVLRTRLATLEPEAVAGLHIRASDWFETQGLADEAIGHALEADDADRAARLISESASATFAAGDQIRTRTWLSRLPSASIDRSPVLSLIRAWARFVVGDMEGIEDSLAIAADTIAAMADERQRDRLTADLDATRSWVAYQSGDLPACIDFARQALRRQPDEGLVANRLVSFALGAALLLTGSVDEAGHELEQVRQASRRANDRIAESLALAWMAQIELLRGRLRQARRLFEQAVDVSTVGGEALPPVGIAQVQLGEVLREQNELGEAEATLRSGLVICSRALGLPEWVFEGRVTLARVLRARGRDRAAATEAAAAERMLQTEIIPGGMRPLVERASGYLDRYRLDVGVLLAAELEGRQDVLVAHTLLAAGDAETALRLAVGNLDVLDPDGELAAAVEARLVGAVALAQLSRRDEALVELGAALVAAMPAGYVRSFLDFGEPLQDLLAEAAETGGPTAGYAGQLLAQARDSGVTPPEGADEDAERLIEPLNEREGELLRHLAAGRSNQEIADEMFISVNTVKWHARNLYGKLGVERRAKAVARGRELGLV